MFFTNSFWNTGNENIKYKIKFIVGEKASVWQASV
jgi:hypothetical protein